MYNASHLAGVIIQHGSAHQHSISVQSRSNICVSDVVVGTGGANCVLQKAALIMECHVKDLDCQSHVTLGLIGLAERNRCESDVGEDTI